MKYKNPFEDHESKSLFSRTLIEVLAKYRTDIHVLAKKANLSPEYERKLLNDEGLTPPPTKLLRKITHTLQGKILPGDLIKIAVSAIYPEEDYKRIKPLLDNAPVARGFIYEFPRQGTILTFQFIRNKFSK